MAGLLDEYRLQPNLPGAMGQTPMPDMSALNQAANQVGSPQTLGSRAMGILGAIGGGIKRSVQDPNFADRLVIGLGGMSLNPNQVAMQQAAANIEQRRALDFMSTQANKTAEQLRREGQDELADMVEANPGQAAAIMAEYLKSKLTAPKAPPAAQLNYEYYVQQETRSGRTPMSFGEFQSANASKTILQAPGTPGFEQQAFGELVNSTIKAVPEVQDSASAQIRLADEINTITELQNSQDQSLFEIYVRQNAPDLANMVLDPDGRMSAAQSMINRIAPTMRETGSGSTSDREMAQYVSSLPSFTQRPEGRALTNQMFQAKADIARKEQELIDKLYSQEITPTQYAQQINKLRTQSLYTAARRAAINNIVPGFFDTTPQIGSGSSITEIDSGITPAD
jgi:hypothetical protein